jgi:hypothetical protein
MVDYGRDCGVALVPWVENNEPAVAVVECWAYGEFFIHTVKPSYKEAMIAAKKLAKR